MSQLYWGKKLNMHLHYSNKFTTASKRFIARRGFPRLLICDNAKTFICNAVKSFLLRWWGGFYDSLARSVKMPLKKILGKAKLTYEEMETVLIEVEGVINCHPLTYIYDDDILEPLIPSYLFAGRNVSE